MKKYIITFLLIPVLSFAQTEKISFTKKLTYEMEKYSQTFPAVVHYSSGALLLEAQEDYRNEKTIMKSGVIGDLNLNLDKTIALHRAEYIPEFTLKKTDDTDEIMGLSCNYYSLQEKPHFKICVVENHPINILGAIKQKGIPINGLVVKVSDDNQIMTLKNIEDYSNHINVNNKELLSKAEDRKRRSEIYSEEGADYSFTDSTYIEEPLSVNEYESNYKNNKEYTNNISLAIDDLEEDSPYWKEIPKYCFHLKDNLPKFKDKELTKHVNNYTGQLCDMYLSIASDDMVDNKTTLDIIRYEETYFRNNKTKFREKDQKLLNDFLNNLD